MRIVGPFCILRGEEIMDHEREHFVFDPNPEGRCVLVEWVEGNDRRSLLVDKKLARELASALGEEASK